MGLRMAARPLENGRYFVLWPVDAPLRSCGAEFVIDAYSQGEIFLLDEVHLQHTFRLSASAWEIWQLAVTY